MTLRATVPDSFTVDAGGAVRVKQEPGRSTEEPAAKRVKREGDHTLPVSQPLSRADHKSFRFVRSSVRNLVI